MVREPVVRMCNTKKVMLVRKLRRCTLLNRFKGKSVSPRGNTFIGFWLFFFILNLSISVRCVGLYISILIIFNFFKS